MLAEIGFTQVVFIGEPGWDDERLATYLDAVVPGTSPIEG